MTVDVVLRCGLRDDALCVLRGWGEGAKQKLGSCQAVTAAGWWLQLLAPLAKPTTRCALEWPECEEGVTGIRFTTARLDRCESVSVLPSMQPCSAHPLGALGALGALRPQEQPGLKPPG